MALLQMVSQPLVAAVGLGATTTRFIGTAGVNNATSNRGARKFLAIAGGSANQFQITRFANTPGAGATTITIGFAVQMSALTDSFYFAPTLGPYVSTEVDAFKVKNSGTSCLLTTAAGTTVATATNVFTKTGGSYPNAPWYYIEISWNYAATTTATVTVKVDGVTVHSGVSVTGAPGNMNLVDGFVWSQNSFASLGVMDIYVIDDTGSANTTFLGDCRVEYLTASSVGGLQEWALGAGATHLAAVQTSDADTGYIRTTAAGQRDTFVMTDLASTTGIVKSVEVEAMVNQESSGIQLFKGAVTIGGSTYIAASATRPMNQGSYGLCATPFDVSPATSSAWTTSEINALEAGVSVS